MNVDVWRPTRWILLVTLLREERNESSFDFPRRAKRIKKKYSVRCSLSARETASRRSDLPNSLPRRKNQNASIAIVVPPDCCRRRVGTVLIATRASCPSIALRGEEKNNLRRPCDAWEIFRRDCGALSLSPRVSLRAGDENRAARFIDPSS